MDLSIFASPESWATLTTLLFLELALGVDNLVFISITSERLPKDKQHLGRRLGLAGALATRIVLLLFASALVHMTAPLFTLSLGPLAHGFSVRDVVLLIGGGYLVYKGVSEIRETSADAGERQASGASPHKGIGLAQAVVMIAAMDVVFSIDSVITAVGLADQLAIIVIAVIVAILLMMLFVDQISRFVTENPGIKLLALVFMTAIGALLVAESIGLGTGVEVGSIDLEKAVVYAGLAVAMVVELAKIRSRKNGGIRE